MAVTPPILYLIADHTFAGGDDPWLRRVGEIADAVAARGAAAPHIYLQLRAKDVGAADRPGLLGRALAAARRADFPVPTDSRRGSTPRLNQIAILRRAAVSEM